MLYLKTSIIFEKSVSVQTKHKTEHRRPACLLYVLAIAILQRLDTFILQPKFKSCISLWHSTIMCSTLSSSHQLQQTRVIFFRVSYPV